VWQTPKLDWSEDDFYNAEDLNRVEGNTAATAELLRTLLGIKVALESVVTDRDYTSIEFADSLNRIERNIRRLSVINIPGLKAQKTNWLPGDAFSYKDAIRLEKNVAILYPILNANLASIKYCGTFACGEELF